MGLLNMLKEKFKKNTPINETHKEVQNEPATQTVETVAQNSSPNGLLKWEYFDNDRKTTFRQGYDITRLLVNPTPLYIGGNYVYDCHVSWYGDDDRVEVDPQTGEFCSRRSIDYSRVLAQIDLNLLQTDPNYYNTVMKELINKKRVDKYLEDGLKDNPDKPCGMYIGGVGVYKDGTCGRFFDPTIGKASHNSFHMRNMREQKKEMEANQRKDAIAYKEAQIAQLQNDISNLRSDDGAR